jgi:hypothetical protein
MVEPARARDGGSEGDVVKTLELGAVEHLVDIDADVVADLGRSRPPRPDPSPGG